MKLYEEIHPNFERFCRARVYGEMSHGDVMNDSLIIAYGKFNLKKSSKELLSFLIGTAIRVLSNIRKKHKAETGVIDLYSNSAIASENSETSLEIRMLYESMAKLPEEQREALILFEITGYSIKEISQIQNTSESAIKQRLRRGRMKLKELLTEPEKEQNYG